MLRRNFLKRSAAAGLGVNLPLSIDFAQTGASLAQDKVYIPAPSPAQRAWMDMRFGMFIHFGINTYYDREWSDGTLNPQGFNPGELDTDQWCRTAKAAGMKYVVITVKHHDGFCLWPSKYTDYSVASTPFKKDVLAMLVESTHKYGLRLGWYYSLWDEHEPSYKRDWWKYIDFMKHQLEELLTQYGDITELWFDGFWKKQKTGWSKKTDLEGEADFQKKLLERDRAFIDAWRLEGAYWWNMDHLYQFIKSIQPDCMVMNNSTSAYPAVPLHPVDIRSGEKYITVKNDQKTWNWLGEEIYLPLQIETTMSVKGNEKFPTGNWFWHEWDTSVRPKKEIVELLKVADKMDANLLLNVGVSSEGKLRPVDENTLMSLQE